MILERLRAIANVRVLTDLRLQRYPNAFSAFYVDPWQAGKEGQFFAH